jgi:serine/threonine-protein kinase
VIILTTLLDIGDEIGRGHFGIVYEAQDPVHGLVAVKVVFRDHTKPPSEWLLLKQRTLKEAQNLKKASHRHVVPVYHLCETDDGEAMLYVMAYCARGSLQKKYEAGPTDICSMRNIATETVQGLEALHARGMVHRDIKPGNILVDAKGCVRIADFGLVTDELILGYAAAAGYKDHLAPEVLSGKNTSVKSDIWALGMTFYRLLHGKVWYEQMRRPREAVPEGGYADTLEWLPHIPKGWRRVIRMMLRDAAKDRYPTASAVMNALSALPMQSQWECDVGLAQIRWTRAKGARRQIVEWDIADSRKTTWTAWSEPTGSTGRRLTIGKGTQVLPRKKADKELRAFFESQG